MCNYIVKKYIIIIKIVTLPSTISSIRKNRSCVLICLIFTLNFCRRMNGKYNKPKQKNLSLKKRTNSYFQKFIEFL